MGKINWVRVFLGGLVATVVNILLGVAASSKYVLGPLHDAEIKALGAQPPHNLLWLYPVYILLGGMGLIWLYAVARPRLGAGAKTAVKTAVGYWFIGVALPNLENVAAGRFSARLMALGSLAALVGLIAASVAGAAIYKEA